MDDKLLAEMSMSIKHIDEKTTKIEKNQDTIAALIAEIQKDNVIAMANNSQLKDRIEKVECKFEKSKEGIYNKIDALETEFRTKTQTETNKFYEYIRDLFKAEKAENESIKTELRKEFEEKLTTGFKIYFDKTKLWIYGGVITIIMILAKDVILGILK